MENKKLAELNRKLKQAVDFEDCLDVFDECDKAGPSFCSFKQVILQKALELAVAFREYAIIINRSKDYPEINNEAIKRQSELAKILFI